MIFWQQLIHNIMTYIFLKHTKNLKFKKHCSIKQICSNRLKSQQICVVSITTIQLKLFSII